MVLHLEAGYCESGANYETVDEIAFSCHKADMYRSDNPGYDYQCPTCDESFAYMSGLLQHAESNACQEDVRDIPLRQFINHLRSRV